MEPRNSHWNVENHVLIYLLGIVSYGWRYVPKYGVQLYEFSYSNWKGSIEDMKNDVWNIVLIHEVKLVVTSKWIYNINHVVDGSMENYNVRFMVKGFSQKEGEEYEETLAQVSRWNSIITFICIDSIMGLKFWVFNSPLN